MCYNANYVEMNGDCLVIYFVINQIKQEYQMKMFMKITERYKVKGKNVIYLLLAPRSWAAILNPSSICNDSSSPCNRERFSSSATNTTLSPAIYNNKFIQFNCYL